MARLLTGLTRGQEQATQERLFLLASYRMEAGIQAEIKRAMLDIASHQGNAGKQAEAIQEHRKRVERILTQAWRSTAETFGGRITRAGSKSKPGMDKKALFGGFRNAISSWIARYGAQKITQITHTTRDQVMAIVNTIVQQGVADGLGQDVVGEAIRKSVTEAGGVLAKARSRVIARTETHQASQAGTLAAAQELDIPMRKEWISANQPGRTRPDHLDADGQVVPLDAKFLVGGEYLSQPGDPSGSAANVINCRCCIAMIVD